MGFGTLLSAVRMIMINRDDSPISGLSRVEDPIRCTGCWLTALMTSTASVDPAGAARYRRLQRQEKGIGISVTNPALAWLGLCYADNKPS